MKRFKIYVSTGYIGGIHEDEVELDEEEIQGKTQEEIESIVLEYANDLLHEKCQAYFEEIEE